MASEDWIDSISKALARGTSRKRFLQIAGSAVVAALLGPGRSAAAEPTCQDCDSGCCDGELCRVNDGKFCGVGGATCTPCKGDEVCIDNQCEPCKANCKGCCTGTACVPGTSEDLCGANGSTCVKCKPGEECIGGKCLGCRPDSCPSGCCLTVGGVTRCMPSEHDHCGVGGVTCVKCAPEQFCKQGTCTNLCSPQECADGCCHVYSGVGGLCVRFPHQNQNDCGKSGETCKRCAPGESCLNGECVPVCDERCPGCCTTAARGRPSVCVNPGTQQNCGKAGQPCKPCARDEFCYEGGCRKQCDANNCPGCCTKDAFGSARCVREPSAQFCGTNGVMCVKCPPGQGCFNGKCDKKCTPQNCPKGCCSADGFTCVQPPTDTACGLNGATCQDCAFQNKICWNGRCEPDCKKTCERCCQGNHCVSEWNDQTCGSNGLACFPCNTKAGEHCIDGVCQVTECTQLNCGGGCCFNNHCLQPDEQNDEHCGNDGFTCRRCETQKGFHCVDGQCVKTICSALNCAGCCEGDNICRPGNSDDFCGVRGGVCQKCDAENGFHCVRGTCVQTQCLPQNCKGCCAGDECQPGTSESACGTGGKACVSCAKDNKCIAGKCTPCGPQTCRNGCCKDGKCLPGTDKANCGTGGGTCKACASTQECINQTCKSNACRVNAPCNPKGPSTCSGRPDSCFCSCTNPPACTAGKCIFFCRDGICA